MARVERHHGAYIIGRELVQVDWDFPYHAQSLGWSLQRVQKVNGKTRHLARHSKRCEHSGTDGTVTCQDCGITAGEFISAAADYLDRIAE